MKHLRQSANLVSTCVKGAHFTWQTTVKRGRALGGALLRLLPLRVGGLTLYWCSAIFRYAAFVVALKRGSGWPYVVLYLKSCAVLLQQSVGGMRISNTRDLKSAVSRTRGLGLPRVIPIQHRKALMSGDIWTFRIWLSLFGLYRVIDMPTKLKLETITEQSRMDPNFLREWYGFLCMFWPLLVRKCRSGVRLTSNHILIGSKPSKRSVTPSLPWCGSETSGLAFSECLAALLINDRSNPSLLNLKPRLLAILKGSPNTGGVRPPLAEPAKVGRPVAKRDLVSSTSISAIFSDVLMWIEYPRNPLNLMRVDLYPFLKEWLSLCEDTVVTRLFMLAQKAASFVERVSKNALAFPGFGRPQGLGKLGFKVEPAGKLRVFAMVDCVTQIVMKPVHDVLFNILGTIPQDGTFDQKRPAELLLQTVGPKGSYWSYDLSAATDRFPLLLQHAVMCFLLGHRLGGLWARLLTWRTFMVPIPPRGTKVPEGTPNAVMYGAGQPMGALTSWAAFSLTHHILVQYAAFKAYGKLDWFTLYALLGDDIVLADAKVAQVYLALLREIGVEVGLAKSLISSNGSFEFAKRTWIHGHEASWISLTALGAAKADHSVLESVLLSAGQRPVMETLRIAARLLGYGYRRLASLPAVLDTKSRLQGLTVLLMRPGSPWSSSVKDWLLMVRPDVVREVPDGVIRVIGQHLWSRLIDGLKASMNAHLRGYSRVRLVDEYGTGATVMDPSNWHRNAWEYFILGTLLRDLKAELDEIIRDAQQIDQPSLEDLDKVWREVQLWREQLDQLPVTPNLVDRASERFEGRKRSSMLRLWRASRRVLNKALLLDSQSGG